LSGYEIHNGISEGPALSRPLLHLDGSRDDGAVSTDSQVAGCYLHGLFDAPDACQGLLAWAGLKGVGDAVDYHAHRLKELDRLADAVEEHLDTDWIQATLGLTSLARSAS
jgi:adenosylcobyric acid synthase